MGKQHGFSIIELLIGLLLSMLVVTILLLLYKQVIHTSVDTTYITEHDNKVQTNLLAIQKLVQSAGYGNGAEGDIKVITDTNEYTLRWRAADTINDDGEGEDFQCFSLSETVTNTGAAGDLKYSHKLILSTLDCDSDDDLEALDFSASSQQQQLSHLHTASNEAIYTYNQGSGNCRPYGIGDINTTSQNLTIKTKLIDGIDIQSHICLLNIQE